jgi:membrane protein implicated in regulation of membrane protease activity
MFFWILAFMLFLGIFLILLEVIVPHGLSMIAGFAVIAFSVYYCFRQAPGLVLPYLVFALIIAGVCAYVVFRTGIRTMTLGAAPPDHPAQSDGASPREEPKIGQRVRVSQPLRPTGMIECGGKHWPARAFRSEIEFKIGEEVEIRERDSIYLVVDRPAAPRLNPASDKG